MFSQYCRTSKKQYGVQYSTTYSPSTYYKLDKTVHLALLRAKILYFILQFKINVQSKSGICNQEDFTVIYLINKTGINKFISIGLRNRQSFCLSVHLLRAMEYPDIKKNQLKQIRNTNDQKTRKLITKVLLIPLIQFNNTHHIILNRTYARTESHLKFY